jgi:hypothetical protein
MTGGLPSPGKDANEIAQALVYLVRERMSLERGNDARTRSTETGEER